MPTQVLMPALSPTMEKGNLAKWLKKEGDFHVVPRGVEHMTEAPEKCWVVLVEPASTKHTGDSKHAITASIEQQLAHLRTPNQPTGQQETPAQWPSKS